MMLKPTEIVTIAVPNNRSALEVAWRFLLHCVLGIIVMYAILWAWALHYAPPEGYAFERLPAVSGLYRYQEPFSKSPSKSLIWNTPIYCGGFGFFDSVKEACPIRFAAFQRITLVQTLIPTYLGSKPVVTTLTGSTTNYIDLDDATVREKWFKSTHRWCIFLAFILGLILTFAVYYLKMSLRLHLIKRVQKAEL